MRLGWDEIKRRAKAFSEDWSDAHYEKGETQSFYNDFFEIFGIKRRTVAVYEKRVKLLENRQGFIDLFWPGTLLIEQKSAGLKLDRAQGQALDYLHGVHPTEQPRWILTCDFQSWVLLDLDTGAELKFRLPDLHKHVTAFDFMLGRRVSFETQAGVTIKAAELMGKLHDALEEAGYVGHDLEQLLVRLLFCLFADDTGIFQPKDIFLQLIDNDTREDGSDTGLVLTQLFQVLDTPEGKRQKGLSGELDAFPYVNGALFSGRLDIPQFDRKMRAHLLDAARHDWAGVSPAIFGSLFQSVMDAKERRAKGAHYTSEANILKVIGPLFLDDLKAELDTIAARRTQRDGLLQDYLHKLAHLRFIDPACGCGNFLVIAYREIRALELAALRLRYPDGGMNAALMSRVTVDQFYGIEYEEFPARIAEVAMWMADHIANNWMNQAFNTNYARIPLQGGATILHADALETDWAALLPPEKCSYIMGNPPFIGAKFQSEHQRAQVRTIANLGGSGGTLDYVAAWFLKAGAYIQANYRIRIAFVSTNSITQGEQVAQLWPILFDRYGLEIAFAHRTFSWGSEARGKAHVHVVIIGLTRRDNEPDEKRLFSYPDIKGEPIESRHGALTAYLVDASRQTRRTMLQPSSVTLSQASTLLNGNVAADGGNLVFSREERASYIASEPLLADWIRPFIGAYDLINGVERYCFWLVDCPPDVIRASPILLSATKAVRAMRISSEKQATRARADMASLFTERRQPTEGQYLAIPRTSSSRRDYIPIEYLSHKIIAANDLQIVPNATLFEFGVLTSLMHMSWVEVSAGRLKSDFRYSAKFTYNTFPWPDATSAQRAKVEALAQAVLDARTAYPTSSLADLYDPDTMPPNLRKAHHALDLAVDKLYRAAPFASDRDRVEHLFGRYEALVNPLETAGVKANKRVARKRAKHGD